MRSPIWYSSVGTRSRLGNNASYLPRSTVTSERSKRRTTPLMMSPTRSLNSVKISCFSARRMCCMSDCLAYWEAMRPKPVGVTSTSNSSPMLASGLMRRASKTEIWSCLERTLSETSSFAKALMSPVLGSMAQRNSRAGPMAFVAAAKKAIGPARELRCAIDPKTGDIRAFAKLLVSERVLSKHDQISVFDARRIKPDANIGEELEVEVTPTGFGRIASQYAKQSLMQHIRRAEKQLIFTEFKDRVGDIISGVVRRFERSDVHVDLGKYEALLPNRERVPTEEYQIGEQIGRA